MTFVKFTRITLSLVFPVLLTAGCAHQKTPPPPETITICDPSGCAERPKNYASFDPSATTPEEQAEDQKIKALEQVAATDPRAAYDLALRFFRGDGVKQNTYKSIKWMREAAEKGNFSAQKALGRLYLTGMQEMGSDAGEAQKWLSIAASRGDKEAKKLLAEANALHWTEQQRYEWSNRWRTIFYNSWGSGYPYYWGWRGNQWYLY
jgi:hypothetical protein